MAGDPKKLGKYDIVGKIGKGAMGEVYKGYDPALNRYVAIKTIAESIDADSDLIERFRREARNAAQLNHPNIITIYDFVEEEGTLYMVMELLEGQDLKSLIKSGSPLTMEQILRIMEQISEGLGFAHSKGMVHRDLKPANVHVAKNGQIKILDFGLVHEAASDMTKTGHVMGTPNYMSPEQVQGLRVDPRSDIFSLGAVFYELLTRKKPFSADSIHATMFKVVQGDREPLSQYTHLPKPMVELVDRALDPKPEKRFSSGNALREHLRKIRNQVLRGEDADSTMTSLAESTIVTPGAEGAAVPPERSVPSRPAPGASGSSSRGTVRHRDVSAPSVGGTASGRPTALYAVAALLLVAVGAGVYYTTMSPSDALEPTVEELSEALVESREELMLRSLDLGDYEGALAQAEELLATNPGNAEAVRIQREATEALEQIDAAVAEARAAIERGATQEAADALSRVLALDPAHPLAAELSQQLNQHFQSQAEEARAASEQARSEASSAGASSQAAYQRAEVLRQEASADFDGSEYTNAASKYLEARDLYRQSFTAQRQAEARRRAEAERQAQSETRAREALETSLRNAESTWNRSLSGATEAGLDQQPSYQKAMQQAREAQRLEGSGDLAGATRAYETAAALLEGAREELAEAERRAEEQRRAAATTATPATTAPVTSSVPAAVQNEAEIREVLAAYERAVETQDIALFRQVKPNLSGDEESRLREAFEHIDSQDVEIAINDITIEGNVATVGVTRRDVIVARGRTQNGNRRQQIFVLTKAGGRWVIEQIQ